MQLKQLFDDDAAVSPVIGVILMVAITVILAAVIGTFVLGLGDSIGENAPSASYDWDQGTDGENATAILTHQSGQNIDQARLSATANGTGVNGFAAAWAGADERVTSGDRVTFVSPDYTGDATNPIGVENEAAPVQAGTEFRVVWTASGGGSSSTLTTYTVN